MKSTRWTLSAFDWLKGLIIFVGTPVLTLIQQLIPDWTPFLTDHFGKSGGIIAQAALAALVTYILKQFGTDDNKVAAKQLTKQGVTLVEPAPPQQP